MRQIAAIIVIILISLTYTTTGANKKFELEFDGEHKTEIEAENVYSEPESVCLILKTLQP